MALTLWVPTPHCGFTSLVLSLGTVASSPFYPHFSSLRSSNSCPPAPNNIVSHCPELLLFGSKAEKIWGNGVIGLQAPHPGDPGSTFGLLAVLKQLD